MRAAKRVAFGGLSGILRRYARDADTAIRLTLDDRAGIMSTTEALRINHVNYRSAAHPVGNRRLREAQPEQANLADLEDELAQTREENVKLVQEVSQLSRRDRSETDADRETCEAELGELRRTIATLEDEVSEVREGLEKQDGELREKGEELVRAVA